MYFRVSIYHILFFSLLLKICLFMYIYATNDLSIFHGNDTPTYLQPIINLINGNGYILNSGIYETSRPPGYPLILGLGYLLGSVEVVTIMIQIVVTTIAIYYVYKVSLLIYESKTFALISASLLSIEPMSMIFSSGLLLTESLLMSFIIFFTYNFLLFLKSRELKYLLFFTFFSIVALYIKPVMLFLPLIMGVYLFFKRVEFKFIFLFLSLFYLSASIWMIRNSEVCGEYRFSTISTTNISYNALEVLNQKYKIDIRAFLDKDIKDGQLKKDIELFKNRKYFTIFIDNFFISAKVYLKGFFATIFGVGASDYFNAFGIDYNNSKLIKGMNNGINSLFGVIIENKTALFLNAFLFVQLMLTYYFFIRGFKSFPQKEALVVFCLLIAYFILISGGVFGYSRFRIPVMPFIEIIVGWGIFNTIKKSVT